MEDTELDESVQRARDAAERLPALRATAQRLVAELARCDEARSDAAELSRSRDRRVEAAGRLRDAESILAQVRGAAAPLPELLRQVRIEQLREAGDPAAMQVLGEVETAQAKLISARSQLKELDEARGALARAQRSISAALDLLGRAGDWGTYDTYFGGGAISSMVKHDRLDQAASATAEVQRAWDRARSELADVQISADVPEISFSSTTRTMDIWFDNIFTDLSVQGKIRDQEYALRTLSARLYELDGGLKADERK